MAAVALINSTHKMNSSQTRQNAPPSATQGKSFQKIRNIHESLRAGLTKRSSTDLHANSGDGEQTVKLSKPRPRDRETNDDGKRRLLGLGLRRTESKAVLAQGGGVPKDKQRGWTPFRAPTLRIATLSSPDLNELAGDADVTPSIHALISAPKIRRPTVQNIHTPPPPSTPSRTHRSPSPVSPSPTPRRRPTQPSSPVPGSSSEARSRSPTVSTQRAPSTSVSRTTSPIRPVHRPPPPLISPSTTSLANGPSSTPSSPPSAARRASSPRVTSRSSSRGHQTNESISSLAPAPFREEIRAASSFLVKELARQPQHIKEKDWIEVEMRMRPLIRAERVWGPSGAAVSASQVGSPGSGSRAAERERRVFGDALRDGVVLCQLMNKLRPNIIRKVYTKEEGSRNIRNFRFAAASYGADPDEMFEDEDLLENTPEGMGSVARTLLYLASVIEEERQSFVVIHDGGKAKSTLFVSASRIVGKTEPVQFDNKAEGFGMSQNTNGGRSPYGTLSRQMGVMSNPELASRARPTSPVSDTRGKDKLARSPGPKVGSPLPLGHRPSQHAQGSSTIRPNRDSSGSPVPSAPSSPKPFVSRSPNYSPKMTRVVTPESKRGRTSSPFLEKPRIEARRPAVDIRSSFGESNSPPLRAPLRLPPTTSNQRQSATSIVTNSSLMTESTAGFSSLLDSRSNGFGTMRTNTTEATSPSSGIPSFSRSEANEAAKAVLLTESPQATRGQLAEIGNPMADRSSLAPPPPEDVVVNSGPVRTSKRDRRSSEAAVDLTRVNEEPDETSLAPSKLLLRRRDKILDNDINKRVARKWPDDFDSALDTDIKAIDELQKELMGGDNSSNTNLEVKPPPVLRPIAIPSRRLDGPPPLLSAEEARTRPILVPRRSKLFSGDNGMLPSPREGLVLNGRDGSPSSGAESSGAPAPPPILRRPTSRNGKRVYVPKGSTPPGSEIIDRGLVQRASPSLAGPSPLSTSLPKESPHIPFPRRTSAEWGPGPSRLPTLPSSSETLRQDAEEKKEARPAVEPQRPGYPRGRHQSEFDSQRRQKPRPGSMDEIGARRSRIESMLEGVRSEERLAQSPPPVRGQIPRRVLVVKEEGQPAVRYSLGDCIGKGQFGSVYRALNTTTGQVVAVKQLSLDGLKPEEVQNLKREVDLLKSLSHPGIVKYEGMAQDEEHLSIVLEYVENGSLGQTLKAFGKLNERLVASYVIRILEGLHYLHKSSVVHCDLKAANILTTKNGNVKLSDFGVSLNLHAMEKVNEVAGTPNWMAPEVIELKGASTKSDIWSLGCVIIELLTGRPPYGDIPNGLTVMFRIVEDESPPIPEGFSPMLRNFLELCFNKDPDCRPNAAILFEHPWLKQKWGAHKELRPQDSIPFLRRVSADLQRSDAVRQLAISMDTSIYNGSAIDEAPQHSPLIRPPLTIQPNDEPLFAHQFTGNSFSKPVTCNVCDEPVRKHALICDFCRLIVHERCEAEGDELPCERRVRSARHDESAPQSPTYGALSSSPPNHLETILHSSPSAYNKLVGNLKKRASRTTSPEPIHGHLPTVLVSGRPPSIPHSRDSDDRRKHTSSTGSAPCTASLRSAVTSSATPSAETPEPVPPRISSIQRPEPKAQNQNHRRQVSEAPSTRPPSDLLGPARSETTAERRARKRDTQQNSKPDGCVVQ